MKILKPCWQCEYDDCGHVWIASSEVPPAQCAKCRRRGWNKKGELQVQEKTAGDAGATRSRQRAAATPGGTKTAAQAVAAALPAPVRAQVKPASQIQQPAAYARPVHDSKTCRLPGCGMCAAAKGGKG